MELFVSAVVKKSICTQSFLDVERVSIAIVTEEQNFWHRCVKFVDEKLKIYCCAWLQSHQNHIFAQTETEREYVKNTLNPFMLQMELKLQNIIIFSS
jgi:hypothetical protein